MCVKGGREGEGGGADTGLKTKTPHVNVGKTPHVNVGNKLLVCLTYSTPYYV